jgi:outer membrane lipoprotein-sorting protein
MKLLSFLLLILVVCTACARAQENEDDEVYDEAAPSTTFPASEKKQFASASSNNYDEDEFVGFENKHQHAPTPTQDAPVHEATPATPATPPLPPPRTNYYLEYVYVGFIVAYVINFWVGKTKNEAIAKAWAESVGKQLRREFTKIGKVSRAPSSEAVGSDNEPDSTDNNSSSKESEDTRHNFVLTKENQHTFTVQATGRANCVGLQATLILRKRHDLVSLLLELFSKNQDVVTLDVLLEDAVSEPFVFAVVRKRDERKFRKANPDTAFCGGGNQIEGLPRSLVVLSELEELSSAFLTSQYEVLQTISKYESTFLKMHFTDQAVLSSKHSSSLSFEFKLPEDVSQMNQIALLTKMALHFIDLVAKTKLSKLGRQKTEKNRAKIVELTEKSAHQQRQEAAQQRKFEKLQQERLKYDTMSPEAQRKYDEKQYKKEMKKKTK